MSTLPELTAGGLACEARAACEPERFLIAGSGSIGRRHLDNLRRLGVRDASFCRTGLRDSAAPAPQAPEEFELEAALARRPRVVLVCNPSARHLALALAAARADVHLLVEKPLSDRLDGTQELAREVQMRGLTALVGFQYRFHPALRQVKRWLDDRAVGELVSGNVHWGEHLPSWHPGEDWRRSYAARADLGGGALRTLCHPFDYLRWLLGEAAWVFAETSNRAFGLDVEDAAQVTLRFRSGALVSVSLDYLRRPREHRLQLVGTGGRIRWSDVDGTAHLHLGDGRAFSHAPGPGFSRNDMFLDEMRHFIACLEDRARPLCTVEDGIAALEIAVAALESSRAGRRVRARADAPARDSGAGALQRAPAAAARRLLADRPLDVVRRRTIVERGSMSGRRVVPFVVEPRFAVDIDTAEQLALAEWLLARHGAELARPGVPA